MDAGVHKAFGVDIDPSTGNMSVAWVEPQWSQSYITLIGSSHDRVFVNTNMSSPVTQNSSEMIPWPDGANYVEQIQWRDAETGKLLAASDFFPLFSRLCYCPCWLWWYYLRHSEHRQYHCPASVTCNQRYLSFCHYSLGYTAEFNSRNHYLINQLICKLIDCNDPNTYQSFSIRTFNL